MEAAILPPPNLSAKDRILRASILLFARTPFSETSLRDIASEAQVDVAYVHRTFGSKAEIFRQALHGLSLLEQTFAPPASPDIVIERICDHLFLRDPQSVEDVRPLHLVIQSCTCAEARTVVDGFITEFIARPLAEVFGLKTLGPAMIAASILCGLMTMRLVIGSQSLQDTPKDEIKALMERALRATLQP